MAAGSIVIDLLMKTGSFETDTKRAEARLRALEKQAAQAGKIIGTAIAAGATVAVAGLSLVVNKQREVIDSQAKLAQQMNTTYTSIANLERAGELAGVGMEQITAASRQLDLNIGKAIQGSKAQAEAFDRLGLSAEKLSKMPADERIAAINRALRDNIAASERSAVAADLFGAKNAAAIQALDAGTIAEAARQVELFGLNLSDVDAAKVEMANDAFSTIGLAIDGVQKQLTVALAPALKLVGDEFMKAIEEAGGFGTVVPEAVDAAIEALGFVINAGNGVVRVFKLSLEAGKLMAYGISGLMLRLTDTIVNGPLAGVNLLIEQMNRIPGVDIAPLRVSGLGLAIRQELDAAERGFEGAKSRIAQLLLEPLAGDRMVQAWRAAIKTAQESAEAAVAGRSSGAIVSTTDPSSPAKPKRNVVSDAERTFEAIQRQIRALETQAATFNMTEREAALYKLGIEGATDAQILAADALLGTLDALQQVADEQKRLNAFMEATPTAKLEKQRADMEFLADAYLRGKINVTQYFEAVDVALGRTADVAKVATDQMSVFAEQAGRNMQDAFAAFLFDPFDGGVKGMVRGFLEALRKMMAEAASAKLFDMIGTWGKSNSGGGFLGTIASVAGAVFGGARANGGDVLPGRAFLIGERGPEMFVPRTAGTVLPNSAIQGARKESRAVSITVQVASGTPAEVRRAAAAGAREGLSALSTAERYR